MSYQKELAAETEAVIKLVAREIMDNSEQFCMGHGFLWVTFKAGKKSYKMLAGSSACSDWMEVESQLIKACPQITSSWVNMD